MLQTDGRAIAYSECEFTFANKLPKQKLTPALHSSAQRHTNILSNQLTAQQLPFSSANCLASSNVTSRWASRSLLLPTKKITCKSNEHQRIQHGPRQAATVTVVKADRKTVWFLEEFASQTSSRLVSQHQQPCASYISSPPHLPSSVPLVVIRIPQCKSGTEQVQAFGDISRLRLRAMLS